MTRRYNLVVLGLLAALSFSGAEAYAKKSLTTKSPSGGSSCGDPSCQSNSDKANNGNGSNSSSSGNSGSGMSVAAPFTPGNGKPKISNGSIILQ